MKAFLCALICLFSTTVFAASTTVYTLDDQGVTRQVKAVTTCAAGTSTFTNEKIAFNMRGCRLHSVRYLYGTTGPTDNSDLVLNEHSATGPDILGGAGANIIDNATNNYAAPLIGTAATEVPIYGDLWPVLSGNSVNAATFIIYYNFVGCGDK